GIEVIEPAESDLEAGGADREADMELDMEADGDRRSLAAARLPVAARSAVDVAPRYGLPANGAIAPASAAAPASQRRHGIMTPSRSAGRRGPRRARPRRRRARPRRTEPRASPARSTSRARWPRTARAAVRTRRP